YQAVQEPVEGTMLTVAREAAEEAEAALEETSDLPTILERVVERCHLSVQRTPQLLPVLAEAGVVDSGGKGLTFILEGMLRLLLGEPLEIRTAEHTVEALHSELSPEDEEGYGYDVQYLIKGEELDVAAIRRHIESLGWSTLVVGDSNMIKVHVHVHNPGEVIGYGASQGVLLDVVVENMQEQYQQFVQERGGPRMASQQSAEPVRAEQPTIEEGTIAAVAVAPGDGLERIFYSLGAAKVISGGQTMNPSMKDILEAVNSLPTDRVVILPNNKNIFMAAEQAAQAANGKQVHVVPTRTIPQGISALLALDPHGEFEEVVEMMTESSEMVETGEVTVSTRTARVDGVQVRKGQIIGLHNDKLTVAGDDVQSVVLDLLDKMGADDLELITLYYGDSVTRQEAVEMAGIIQEAYPDHEVELREGGQPHYFYILSVE
ncbi:MAG TPA: DAK2 domain-containing protein, partial [Aggregatilineales bacterium]|nr:DAK2 domain-containing protein [Aggregatilineales bacterium]